MAQDVARELDNTPDEPTLLSRPGDTLVGIVRTIDTVLSTSSEGRNHRVVIETDEGELVTLYGRDTVPARELADEILASVIGSQSNDCRTCPARRVAAIGCSSKTRWTRTTTHRRRYRMRTTGTSPSPSSTSRSAMARSC